VLRLKNTYSGEIEAFESLEPGVVRMYTCGPTVYSFAHIGNFRSFLFADVLRRVLQRIGYRVRQVMNITDVGHMTQDHLADSSGEDKLSRAARELGWNPYEVAAHYERAFIEDAKRLRLSVYEGEDAHEPSVHPRATRHIPEMLVMIQQLLQRGFAYVDDLGQAYFDVSRFPDYGALSGKVLDELEPGARVAVRGGKRDPRDFALWKVDPGHLMQWDPHGPGGWPDGDYDRLRSMTPDGVDARLRPGFPGWHIECSAMSRAHLGPEIDIHTGGEDNIFPHHECEIAQSYGASGRRGSKTFARYWVHGRHLLVDGKKMSKSDGTFFTPRDLFDPRAAGRSDLADKLESMGFHGGRVSPSTLRYALIANQYVQPMNFTLDALVQARASIERIQTLYDRLVEIADRARADSEVEEIVMRSERAFDEALEDNLNMPRALAALFRATAELNQRKLSPGGASSALRFLDGVESVLAVLDRRVRSGLLTKADLQGRACSAAVPGPPVSADMTLDPRQIEAMILRRYIAKTAADFVTADSIRRDLEKAGVAIEDLPAGVRWRLR
jgi:cysteinyl-tRNA synthetase